MRIAYVCADLGVPLFGRKGASIHVRELVRALRALGHEILVVTPRAEGERPRDFTALVEEIRPDAAYDAAVDTLGRSDGAGAVARDLRSLLYRESLRRHALEPLRRFAPDVVYERYSLFGDAGLGLARELDVPFVLEVNAPLTDEQSRHRGLVLADLARLIEFEVLRAADRVLTVSTALERWLVQVGVDPGRVTVVPNAVDPAKFDVPPEQTAPIREMLGAESAALVGFVGSLKPWHDVSGLIDAVAELADAERPVKLVVIGTGPEQEALEKRARRARVDALFMGGLQHDRVPAHVAALDVAVAPYSSDDGFYFSPLKVVEYLAAAVPVVAAEVGDLRHCVRPGETGWLYRPGDARSLAGAIGAVVSDPDAKRIARAGRDHARREHTWNGAAERVVELAAGARRSR